MYVSKMGLQGQEYFENWAQRTPFCAISGLLPLSSYPILTSYPKPILSLSLGNRERKVLAIWFLARFITFNTSYHIPQKLYSKTPILFKYLD